MKNPAGCLDELREQLKLRGTGLETGWPTVDETLDGGLKPGRVYTILGRSGVGKTLLTTNLAEAAARVQPVLFISLEMTAGEIMERVSLKFLGISRADFEGAVLNEEPLGLDKLQLYVDDRAGQTWADIFETTAKMTNLEMTPALLVVDHAGLMGEPGAGSVDRIVGAFQHAKRAAKDLECPVIMVHQTGRGWNQTQGKDHGHRPVSMEDGLYGGEQDSDVIFGFYRPARDPATGHTFPRDLGFLQVVKNRHGVEDTIGVPMSLDFSTMTIREYPNKELALKMLQSGTP